MVDWASVRGRAGTWPQGGRALAWTPPRVPDISRWLARRLAPWIAAEVAPGRLMPWLPVTFGAGIAVYFTADREPAWWAALALAAALAGAAITARRRPIAFPLVLGGAAIAAGFATATLRTLALDHAVLRAPAYNVTLSGSSRAARSARRPTASWCACTRSTRRASMGCSSGCACR